MRDGLRVECPRPIPTGPAICYNADDFVMEVCIEKTDHCRRSPYHNTGVFHDTRPHAGCAGLDNIRRSPAIWRVHDL